MTTVILYSKPGCHLCDDARTLLEDLATEHGFELRDVNIETDPRLFARYRYEIPVIAVGETVLARGRVDQRALVAALRRL